MDKHRHVGLYTTVGNRNKLETTKNGSTPEKVKKTRLGSEPISATPSSLNSPCGTPLDDLNCVCTGEELVRPVPVFYRWASHDSYSNTTSLQTTTVTTPDCARDREKTLKQQAVGHQSSIMHYES